MATAGEDFIYSEETDDTEPAISSDKDLSDWKETEESEPVISEDLNCPLCLKVFRSPRRLPCLHSFCQDCLESHISSTASVEGLVKKICCPICENVAWSGEVSANKLVHVFPLNLLMLSILSKSGSVNLQCNACQSADLLSEAEDLCTVCEEALCGQCSKTHRSPRLSATHTILKIEDLPSKQETVLKNNVMFHCTAHAYFPIEYYCKGHDIQLCAKCIIASHKNCSEIIELKSDALNLSDTLNHTKEHMEQLEIQIKEFTDVNALNREELETEVTSTTELIQLVQTSLIEMISDAFDDLEERVKEKGNSIFKKEKKRLKKFNNGCQSHLAAIRNSKAVLESASKCATQTQMFLLTTKIMNQLSISERHIDDKYSQNDIISLQLDIDPELISIFKIIRGKISRLRIKRNDNIQVTTDEFKPLVENMHEFLGMTQEELDSVKLVTKEFGKFLRRKCVIL